MLRRIRRRSYVHLISIILLPTFCLLLWIYYPQQVVHDLTKQIPCKTLHRNILCNSSHNETSEAMQSGSKKGNTAYHFTSDKARNSRSIAKKRDYMANHAHIHSRTHIKRGKFKIIISEELSSVV